MSTQNTEDTVDFDTNISHWVDEYRRLKAQVSELTERLDIARSHIETALGDATIGFVDNQPVVRWTVVSSERFDVKKAREVLPPQVLNLLTSTSTSRRFTLVDLDKA